MRSGWGKRAESWNPDNTEANLILISSYTLSSSLIARPCFYFDWNSKQRSDVILYIIYFRNIFLVFVLRIQADIILLHFAFFIAQMFFSQIESKTIRKKIMIHLLRYLLYCSGLKPNLHYLWSVPIHWREKKQKNREAIKDAITVI